MTVLLNTLTIDPANRDRVLDILRENIDTVIRTLDGWVSTDLVVSADDKRIVIHSRWRDAAAVAAMRADPRMVAYFPRLAALATFESLVGELAHAASA